jgi:hypothetical protein
MRVFRMFGFMMATALSARSEECAVNVILHIDASTRFGVIPKAERITTEMFAEIGVKVRLLASGLVSDSNSNPGCPPAIEALLESKVPANVRPYALAYAAPYADSGIRIHVFVDRIIRDGDPCVSCLLGHVLVHEIAHILEGTARHSQYGIMKASWTQRDYAQMQMHALRFADLDVEMIHRRWPRQLGE